MMAPVNNTVEHYKKARLPPVASAGLIGWLRQNLFSSVSNTILTLVSVYLLSLAIPAILDWAFLSSQVSGNTRFDCKVEGACWAWLDQRFGQFLFGFYPEGERWRVILAFILLFPALIPWLTQGVPGQRYLRWFSIAYPVIARILLAGGLGLQEIPTDKFGGFMLNLVVGLS